MDNTELYTRIGTTSIGITGAALLLIGVMAFYNAWLQHTQQNRALWPPDVMASFGTAIFLVGGVLLLRPFIEYNWAPAFLDWGRPVGVALRFCMAVASVYLGVVMLGGGFVDEDES